VTPFAGFKAVDSVINRRETTKTIVNKSNPTPPSPGPSREPSPSTFAIKQQGGGKGKGTKRKNPERSSSSSSKSPSGVWCGVRHSLSLLVQIPLIATVLSLSSFSLLRSLSCCLQSSSPGQLCDSSMRCLPQKWPEQKPQSPTMRCAASRQSLKPQRIFLGPPPRMGCARWMVDSRVMACDVSGAEGSVRCLPA
jgi:hypothetical protein